MITLNELFSKYENDFLSNIKKENIIKIIAFLKKENCNFIDELLENYLDLFVFDYEEFISKYNKLFQKYDGLFLKKVSEDMNLLEEFYTI